MIHTVTGSIHKEDLGKTLMHEHILFGYNGYQGDSTLGGFKHEEAMQICTDLVKNIQAHGVKTLVDATPNECGRNPLFLKELSEKTGLQILCSTGYYYEGEGGTAYFKFRQSLLGDISNEIFDMMMTELTVGIGNTGIKAGVIKLASSKNEITTYEKAFFRAAAKAQKETGCTIITHTQEGTMGPEQAEFLIAEGANPDRIMIGHMDGNTNVDYHIQTLEKGVHVAFDRFGIQVLVGMPMDEQKMVTFAELVNRGYADKLHLSHDFIFHWLGRPFEIPAPAQPLVKNWYPSSIFDNAFPALKAKGIADEVLEKILTDNVCNLFE